VLAYGLVLAAFNAGMVGHVVDDALVVGGSGAGEYRISIGSGRVTVAVEADQLDTADVRADAAALTDSLAGRGPDVGEILGRRDTLTSALSLMRQFFLAPT
jgi:hypothetical protein